MVKYVFFFFNYNLNFFYFLLKKMDNSNNVILVTGSYDQTLIFWDPIQGNSMFHIDYPEKVKK